MVEWGLHTSSASVASEAIAFEATASEATETSDAFAASEVLEVAWLAIPP